MAEIKILSFNVKGIKDDEKRLLIFDWCKNRKADIYFLQETHSEVKTEKFWTQNWGGKIVFSHGSTGARGVAMMFDKNLNYKLIDTKTDNNGRIIVVDIEIREIRYTIVNLYAPNSDTPEFFSNIGDLIDNFENVNLLIGGDFNLVLNVNLDKKGGRPSTHEKCRKFVINMMEDRDLVDVWRREHPTEFGYTWRSYTPPIYLL